MSPDFAMVSAELVRCGGQLSHGAIKLCAFLLGCQHKRAQPRDEDDDRHDWALNAVFWFSHAEAAAALGVDRRTVRRWTRELRQAGILQGEEDYYGLEYDPTWQKWFPLDLTRAAELPAHQWRVWAVLASYSNQRGIAWPNLHTLARDTGLKRSAVLETLGALQGLGLIERHRRRRGSTLTGVWRGGRTNTGPQEDTDRTPNRTDTELQVGHRPDPSTIPLVPSLNSMFEVEREAAPYQTHLMLPITGGAAPDQQQKPARQGECEASPCEPEDREALEGWLAEAEAVFADLGHGPVDQALRSITLRRIADLKERMAA